MRFSQTKPCLHCPFRTDIPGYITPERAASIADTLLKKQGTFACHETLSRTLRQTENTQHCAGAMIFLEALERPNQMMRWMERLTDGNGKPFYNRNLLDYTAPIVKTRKEFVEHQRITYCAGGNVEPVSHCISFSNVDDCDSDT